MWLYSHGTGARGAECPAGEVTLLAGCCLLSLVVQPCGAHEEHVWRLLAQSHLLGLEDTCKVIESNPQHDPVPRCHGHTLLSTSRGCGHGCWQGHGAGSWLWAVSVGKALTERRSAGSSAEAAQNPRHSKGAQAQAGHSAARYLQLPLSKVVESTAAVPDPSGCASV